MSGYNGEKGETVLGSASTDNDELNAFYARFDFHEFSQTRCELMDRLAEIPVGDRAKR